MLLRSLISPKCSLEALEISNASSEHFGPYQASQKHRFYTFMGMRGSTLGMGLVDIKKAESIKNELVKQFTWSHGVPLC